VQVGPSRAVGLRTNPSRLGFAVRRLDPVLLRRGPAARPGRLRVPATRTRPGDGLLV